MGIGHLPIDRSVYSATALSIQLQASQAIVNRQVGIAEALVEREFARHPDLAQRYGERARERALQNAGSHLSFLAQALALNSQEVFNHYIAWAKVMLDRRTVLPIGLGLHLQYLVEILREMLPEELSAPAAKVVTVAMREIPALPQTIPTFLHDGAPLSRLAHQYFAALHRGEQHAASALVLEAVSGGTPVKDIYLQVLEPTQREIGRLWQTESITVAQERFCTTSTQLIMSQLCPHFPAVAKNGHTMVATCVAGNLHEIGVRMVVDFFEMDGWSTCYLGPNTPHARVISTLIERDADVLAVSATISYHVEAVRDLICAVRADHVASKVTILVGGYPFNLDPALWKKIGADGSASNAQLAIDLANQLVIERTACASASGVGMEQGNPITVGRRRDCPR